MDVLDKFFIQYAYKFPKGYPDLKDKQDVLLLESILEELGVRVKMNERIDTTLSSAITELPPVLAFNDGYKPSSIEDFKTKRST